MARVLVGVLLGLVLLGTVAATKVTVSTRVRILESAQDERGIPEYTPEIVDDSGNVVTKRCYRCNISKVMEADNEDTQVIWTEKDYAEFRKNPAERTANILKQLQDLRNKPRHGTQKDIEQMERLLGLYRVLKVELIKHLKQNHVPVPELPSEESKNTFVDAAGRHWGNAEMRDSLQELLDDRDKQIKEEKADMLNASAQAMMAQGDSTANVDSKPIVGKVDPVNAKSNLPVELPTPTIRVTATSVGECHCMRAPKGVKCPCRDTRSMLSADAVHSNGPAVHVGSFGQSSTIANFASSGADHSVGVGSFPPTDPKYATPGNGIDVGGTNPSAPFGTPVGFDGRRFSPHDDNFEPVKEFPRNRLPGSPELLAAQKEEQQRLILEKKIFFNRLMATPQCPCGCPIDECPCRCKGARFLVPSGPPQTPVRFVSAKPAQPPAFTQPASALPSNRAVKAHGSGPDCKPPLCFTG